MVILKSKSKRSSKPSIKPAAWEGNGTVLPTGTVFGPDLSSLLDLFELMTGGGKIGEGCTRQTYASGSDQVIKWEKPGNFQNVHEWNLWRSLSQYPELQQFFAPCISISPNGRWLWQKRVQPVNPDCNPKMLGMHRMFLDWDLDAKNLGWLDGRVVLCDYGLLQFDIQHLLTHLQPTTKKKKQAVK